MIDFNFESFTKPIHTFYLLYQVEIVCIILMIVSIAYVYVIKVKANEVKEK